MCVVDLETTGLNPKSNEIIEIALLPLSSSYEIEKSVIPFHLMLKPERERNINEIKYKENYAHCCLNGFESGRASEIFLEWFEKLQLGPNKKIMPIAQNWPFDRSFLMNWLGYNTFEYIFHPYYRDTMMMSLFVNDSADMINEKCPFPKLNLTYLCKMLGIENDRAHTALSDCIATAKCYKKIIERHDYWKA